MEVIFSNPYKDGEPVYLIGDFTYGDRIDITNNVFVAKLSDGVHKYNYIRNNNTCVFSNKSHTEDANIISIKDGKFTDTFLKESEEFKDIDVFNSEGNRNRDIVGNYDEMMKWYIKAANCGSTLALIQIGVYYRDIAKNTEDMKRSFASAISAGDVNGFIYLGDFHTFGDKDYEKAVACYMMASKHGCDSADIKLAECFATILENVDDVKNPSLVATAKEYMSRISK